MGEVADIPANAVDGFEHVGDIFSGVRKAENLVSVRLESNQFVLEPARMQRKERAMDFEASIFCR
jgi:hypothetical protein